ncbi:MAG: right-handed parallel beta-helix repeat-containing protein [Prevotellaceae bacterium]|nr:right-handed parallel beta-helix repeat-containing protein [Prevotellaceae bacterium]
MKPAATFLLLCLACHAHAQTISVADFGVRANSFADAVEGVKQAIAACKVQPGAALVFPKGRYDFYPDSAEKREYYISNTSSETECPSKVKTIGLLFEDMKNLTIEGNGSRFVLHGKMISWAFIRCENVLLQNIAVDFERPTISELAFAEVSPSRVVVNVHPDSKYDLIDGKLCFYGEKWTMRSTFSILTDSVEGTALYSSFDPLREGRATELSPNRLSVEGSFGGTNYKVGKTLTIRDPDRDHVGALVSNSVNVRLKNIDMHFMHGLGIVSQFSENLAYTRVSVSPSRGRTIASFADGMHFSGCRGHILVDSCRFKGLHDDPMNVHGTYLRITAQPSPQTVVVRFMHSQTYGFQAFYERDAVAFIHAPSLQLRGMAVVKNVRRISEREMLLELSAPLPSGVGVSDCIENLTWTPSLTVRNCRFEMTNTRGLLVTTPRKVVIEDNHFYRTGMYAIQISGDAGSWYESGAVRDVTIRRNIFEECGYNRGWRDSYAIAVNPEVHELVEGRYVHRNIRILNNVFKLLDGLALKAKSVDGLTFKGNAVGRSAWTPPLRSASDPSENPAGPFLLESCKNVEILNNSSE